MFLKNKYIIGWRSSFISAAQHKEKKTEIVEIKIIAEVI
jgi:hypothetical protein